MSRNGFRVLDSDLHVIEPRDLYERYLDPRYKARAPRPLDARQAYVSNWIGVGARLGVGSAAADGPREAVAVDDPVAHVRLPGIERAGCPGFVTGIEVALVEVAGLDHMEVGVEDAEPVSAHDGLPPRRCSVQFQLAGRLCTRLSALSRSARRRVRILGRRGHAGRGTIGRPVLTERRQTQQTRGGNSPRVLFFGNGPALCA